MEKSSAGALQLFAVLAFQTTLMTLDLSWSRLTWVKLLSFTELLSSDLLLLRELELLTCDCEW